MRIFSWIIIVTTTMLFSQYTYCQDKEKSLSFNAGLNLAHPTFIIFDENGFQKSIPAYQLNFNKDFFLNKPYGLNISIGLNKNSFNAGRQVGTVYSIKQLDLTYLSLEGGANYKIFIKNIDFWCSPNLRVSRIVSQNYSDYYTGPSLSSSDIGLNFKVGAKLPSMPVRPYLLFNYYYGLIKAAANSVVTGNGQTLNEYIRNRSIGIQVGFYF